MLKLISEQKETLYKIQKELNLDSKRLNRYANGSISIRKMPCELVVALSNYFKIETNILFDKMNKYQLNKSTKNRQLNEKKFIAR